MGIPEERPMNRRIEVSTQKAFDRAIKDGDIPVCIGGDLYLETTGQEAPYIVAMDGKLHVEAWESSQPHVVAWESSQPHVVAWESSQPHVVARESSQPHVEAWESSQPHVEARESSQPHVEAWESSQPHVEARESSQPHVVARESSQPHVVAWESSQPHVVARESSQPHVEARGYAQLQVRGAVIVKAGKNNAVTVHGKLAKVRGGRVVRVSAITTAKAWCEHHGVQVCRGVAVVYKAVDDKYRSSYSGDYTPGTVPEAADWDGGVAECGGGLHFSPSPACAKSFFPQATKFLVCQVRLKDMRKPTESDNYTTKIKARGCCQPVVECDIVGRIKA